MPLSDDDNNFIEDVEFGLRRWNEYATSDVARLCKTIRKLEVENAELRRGNKIQHDDALIALRCEIENAPWVYAFHQDGMWWTHEQPLSKDTHRAKLVRVEKLK